MQMENHMDVVMKQMEKFISKSGCGISLCSLMTSIHFSICVTFIKNFFLTDGSMYIQITVTVTLHFPPANTALCTRTVSHHKSHVSAHCAACPTGDDALLLNHQTTFARRVAPIPGADAVRTLMHIQGGPHTMPCAMPVVQPQAPEGGPG